MQFSVGAHVLPQEPQFVGVLFDSTQVREQQSSVLVQACPQAPQLAVLESRLAHEPSPQSVVPGAQTVPAPPSGADELEGHAAPTQETSWYELNPST
jgi:hypothetical protein